MRAGKDEMMTPRVQDWMLICQYGAAFPQSEKDIDDHNWSLAGMAYLNLQELSSFISRQYLEYVPQPAATTADPKRLQGKQLVAYNIVRDHFKVQDRATPLRLIISGTAGTGKSYLIRCLKLLLAGNCASQLQLEWLHSMLMATPSTPCLDFQSRETSNNSKATDCR